MVQVGAVWTTTMIPSHLPLSIQCAIFQKVVCIKKNQFHRLQACLQQVMATWSRHMTVGTHPNTCHVTVGTRPTTCHMTERTRPTTRHMTEVTHPNTCHMTVGTRPMSCHMTVGTYPPPSHMTEGTNPYQIRQ